MKNIRFLFVKIINKKNKLRFILDEYLGIYFRYSLLYITYIISY